jgi:hypothetical protein
MDTLGFDCGEFNTGQLIEDCQSVSDQALLIVNHVEKDQCHFRIMSSWLLAPRGASALNNARNLAPWERPSSRWTSILAMTPLKP